MKRYGQQKLWGAAWVLMALAIAGQAADSPITVRSTSRTIPERGKVEALQLTVGRSQTSFIMPAGWRVGSVSDGVVIQAGDYSATLTLRVRAGAQVSAGQLREQLATGADRVAIQREFTCATGLGQATVLDGELAGDQDLRLQTRTICIAKDGKTVHFELKARPADFPKHQKTLEYLVASLRTE